MTTAVEPKLPPRQAPPSRVEPVRRRRVRPAQIMLYVALVLGALVFLTPFSWLLNNSLRTAQEANSTRVDVLPVPVNPQWQNYPRALEQMGFLDAMANTVVVTTAVVAGQVLSCSLVGFGFARFRFRGKSTMFILMLSTMMLPAQVTMIPVFILFRQMGMIDTFWPLIIPAWLASPFFVFMFRQFFAAIPEELVEAARVDGASNLRIYAQLMLPLSGPVIAIVALQSFLTSWNEFMGPLIYLNSAENRTIALALNAFKGQYGVTEANLLMAATAVTMLPCVVLFFAAQRHFVESVAMTGLKS